MSRYLRELVQIAQTALPQLQHDLQNASTLFTQQACVQKLHNIVTYLVYEAIANATSAPAAGNGQPIAPISPLGTLPIVSPTPVEISPPAVSASQVTEVMVTTQGTRVIPPGGSQPALVLPPGVPVTAEHMQSAAPPIPRPATPGHPAEMFPVAGISPEVAAALARSRQAAPDPTGGARNITNEPAGG